MVVLIVFYVCVLSLVKRRGLAYLHGCLVDGLVGRWFVVLGFVWFVCLGWFELGVCIAVVVCVAVVAAWVVWFGWFVVLVFVCFLPSCWVLVSFCGCDLVVVLLVM